MNDMTILNNQIPFKHYLIEAALKCIEDAELTPYLVCDTKQDAVVLPSYLSKDPTLTLSLSRFAIRNFALSEQGLGFTATFSGSPFQIFLPLAAIIAVYAKETGHGLVTAGDFNFAQLFETEKLTENTPVSAVPESLKGVKTRKFESIDNNGTVKAKPRSKGKKPVLQLIKS